MQTRCEVGGLADDSALNSENDELKEQFADVMAHGTAAQKQALLAVYRPFTLLALVALPLALAPVRAVRGGVAGPGLIATLGQTGRLQLAFGVVFGVPVLGFAA